MVINAQRDQPSYRYRSRMATGLNEVRGLERDIIEHWVGGLIYAIQSIEYLIKCRLIGPIGLAAEADEGHLL
jgi:hypothetical protein